MTTTTVTEEIDRLGWTIAFRRPRANRFLRVDDLNVSWQEATEIAKMIGFHYPELEVWYVSTAQAEDSGLVVPEDRRNVLTESGRRVRIFEGGKRAEFDRVFPFATDDLPTLEGLHARLSSAEGEPSEIRSTVLEALATELRLRAALA